VVSLVAPEDGHLVGAIEAICEAQLVFENPESPETATALKPNSMEALFSRNRSLRQRFRRVRQAATSESDGSVGARKH